MNETTNQAPLKVGIWCKYHITLEPSEGIGVFAHNLARGIANIPDGPDVILSVRAGDEALVAETVELGNGRIQTAAPKVQAAGATDKSLSGKFKRYVSRLGAKLERKLARRKQRRAFHFEEMFRKRKMMPQNPDDFGPGTIPCTLLAHFFALIVKFVNVFVKLAKWLCDLVSPDQEIAKDPRVFDHEQNNEIIAQADVWLIPYVGLDIPIDKPSVVVVHDLVCYHYPETLSPEAFEIFKRLSTRTAETATIAATMSNFILKNDLEGILHLPKSKTRVLESAAPRDFCEAGDFAAAAAEHPVLEAEYILYPGAFRAYKNHSGLVQALSLLRYAGDKDLHLVFTGIHSTPPALAKMIKTLGLEDRVHVLGRVPRSTLALLYQNATMTVVPSFYEQGSFPIMEAIHWRCPVACSRIESLVELFEPMGSAMKFFDPGRIDEMADVLADVRRNRRFVLAAQQAASKKMFERTWTDAAYDWVEVFEEAIAMYHGRPLKKKVAPETRELQRAA